MSNRIIGKIAEVTSDREVIVNRGSERGVEVGTYFSVKGDPIEVTDPDTGEPIGSVSPVKVVVRVEEVADKFCIARTYRTRRVKVSEEEPGSDIARALHAATSLSSVLQPPRPAKYETRVETLRADPKQGRPITPADSVVRVGDVVESVLEGESIDPVTTTLFR